jgi:FMN phosphatase YigB (HAD superfamily)
MSIRYILFDLDGTLLPMDQDVFVKAYFSGLVTKLAPHGYEPKTLIETIWGGTAAMVKNDGSKTNEQAFWDFFATVFGQTAKADEPRFDEFYRTDFQQVQTVCGFDERAAQTITALKEMGYMLALATNPIFPAIATESRMRWAGLNKDDFVLYTTYENSRRCKPNPDYYRDILAQLGAKPEECLMVGNDVSEDMIAGELGMKVFLLTDCLINKHSKDISGYPQGSFDALMDYIRTL